MYCKWPQNVVLVVTTILFLHTPQAAGFIQDHSVDWLGVCIGQEGGTRPVSANQHYIAMHKYMYTGG